MEHDSYLQQQRKQQRKRLGVFFVLFVFAFGTLFLWLNREGEEAETFVPAPTEEKPPAEQEATEELASEAVVPSVSDGATATGESPEEILPVAEKATQKEKEQTEEMAVSTAEGESVQQTSDEVPQQEAAPAATPHFETGAVTASRLNVRREPSLTAERIHTLSRGEQVMIRGEEDEWYHIQTRDGSLEGWVAKRYVDILSGEEQARSS